MLDFTQVRSREMTWAALTGGLTRTDLAGLTDEMVDTMLALIADCVDADVAFVPLDPAAEDTYAETPDEVTLAWTLGHVIAHTTASAEEAAFLAAELARGVANHGRSRSEVPWRPVTTVAQCRARLEESRRMRLATLAVWPDSPGPTARRFRADGEAFDCVGQFVVGLAHDDSHLAQIEAIVGQARAARMTAPRPAG
jgi:hypothetical protein